MRQATLDFQRQAVESLGRYKTVQEAAKALGVAERTVRDWCSNVGAPAPRFLVNRPKGKVFTHSIASGVLQKVLICPDVHVPYHDKNAWETFLLVAKEWKPDQLVFLGDFADFYQVSQFPKKPECVLSFEDECGAVDYELDRVSALEIPIVKFVKGNHENRLEKEIAANARWASGLVSSRKLLKVDERGWEWVDYGKHTSIGKLNFTHDLNRCGEYAAAQSVKDMGHNIIFGHTHRASQFYISNVMGDRHMGLTCGWLGDADAIAFEYKHRAKILRENQLGFAVAYVKETDGCGWTHFVPIINGEAVVDGKIYSAGG